MRELVFLKLGGSLITDKTRRYTPRLDRLQELAGEIKSSLEELPDIQLLLGHGSGSFGHFAVQEHLAPLISASGAPAKRGPQNSYWLGFSEVSYRASELNRHVMNALHGAGIPAMALAPSAMVTTADGRIVTWDMTSLNAALKADLVPVIFGDIVFDSVLGGKVLSTEALMIHLAERLHPQRILLAGLEEAVWADFPRRKTRVEKITATSYHSFAARIGGSVATDVTGGMKTKVEEMLALTSVVDGLTVHIFSGEKTGNLKKALTHDALGTILARE